MVTGIDWAGVKRDVCERIDALAALVAHVEAGPSPTLARKVIEELVIPSVRHLGAFCAAVEIKPEAPAERNGDGKPNEGKAEWKAEAQPEAAGPRVERPRRRKLELPD